MRVGLIGAGWIAEEHVAILRRLAGVELVAVCAGYGRIDVLHGIDLALRPGEVFALLGPNGAGKSTTLAVASGQIAPSTGGVFIYVGFLPNSQIFGPEFPKDAQGFVITDDKMETPVPGLYVVGDVRSQYVRQISNAVGDATTAAVAATRYIEEIDATGSPAAAEEVERLLVDA